MMCSTITNRVPSWLEHIKLDSAESSYIQELKQKVQNGNAYHH